MAVYRTQEEALEELAGIGVRKEQGILAGDPFQAIAEILVGHDGKPLVLMPDGGIHKRL